MQAKYELIKTMPNGTQTSRLFVSRSNALGAFGLAVGSGRYEDVYLVDVCKREIVKMSCAILSRIEFYV